MMMKNWKTPLTVIFLLISSLSLVFLAGCESLPPTLSEDELREAAIECLREEYQDEDLELGANLLTFRTISHDEGTDSSNFTVVASSDKIQVQCRVILHYEVVEDDWVLTDYEVEEEAFQEIG